VPVIDRAVVARYRILHEGHALALDRVGGKPGWAFRLEGQAFQS
jgi:hypothetical protein